MFPLEMTLTPIPKDGAPGNNSQLKWPGKPSWFRIDDSVLAKNLARQPEFS